MKLTNIMADLNGIDELFPEQVVVAGYLLEMAPLERAKVMTQW